MASATVGIVILTHTSRSGALVMGPVVGCRLKMEARLGNPTWPLRSLNQQPPASGGRLARVRPRLGVVPLVPLVPKVWAELGTAGTMGTPHLVLLPRTSRARPMCRPDPVPISITGRAVAAS